MRAVSPTKSVPKMEQQEPSREDDIDPVGGVEHEKEVEKTQNVCGIEDSSDKDSSSPLAAKGSSFLIDDILCQGRKVRFGSK